jgi:glycosyltransferase involved in cell wall biosynthesis
MVAILVARLLRKPVALKIVGDNAWEYAIRKRLTADGIDLFQVAAYPLKLRLVRSLVRAYARLSSLLIVPSEYLRRIVAGWGVPPERSRVIRNALTAAMTTEEQKALDRASVRAALGIAGPLVVTSARLYPWKNLDVLIRLVPALPKESTLAIIGDGPERSALQTLSHQTGVAGRVRFTGSVAHDEVQRYLRAADLFVLNTRYEGLSHVLLEAMAAGTPVVASSVGGNPEVIAHERNGLLVPPDDATAIVHAIERLIADKALAHRLARQAQEDVQRFRWDTLVEQTASALESLVKPAPCAPPSGSRSPAVSTIEEETDGR